VTVRPATWDDLERAAGLLGARTAGGSPTPGAQLELLRAEWKLASFEVGRDNVVASALHRLLDDAYRGWGRNYVPMAHDDWVRWMTGDVEFDPAVWWLAERDGVLAGCALHWSSGWLKDLAVA
jgi:hypothetical protein